MYAHVFRSSKWIIMSCPSSERIGSFLAQHERCGVYSRWIRPPFTRRPDEQPHRTFSHYSRKEASRGAEGEELAMMCTDRHFRSPNFYKVRQRQEEAKVVRPLMSFNHDCDNVRRRRFIFRSMPKHNVLFMWEICCILLCPILLYSFSVIEFEIGRIQVGIQGWSDLCNESDLQQTKYRSTWKKNRIRSKQVEE